MKTLTIERIRKTVLVTFVLLGVGAALLLVHIRLSLDASRQELSIRVDERNRLKADINRMQTAIEEYKKEIEDIQPYLFTERDVPSFLDSISQFALENDVTVIDMKTQRFQEVVLPDEIAESMRASQGRFQMRAEQEQAIPPEQIMTFAAMPIQIKIQGEFEALVDFLYAMEGYKQLITLSNVQIAVTRDYPFLECDFLLRIYSMKTLKELESI